MVDSKICSKFALAKRWYRLMVRPQDSQSCNPGSIPGTTTKKASDRLLEAFFIVVLLFVAELLSAFKG